MPKNATSETRKNNAPSLRCFVAMAFGHDDTDFVYDQYICKAIESAKRVFLKWVKVE
jgi:hypothetical protein